MSGRVKGEEGKETILVIKLGALGDLVLCQPVFAAIRAHHPRARVILLTGPAFEAFGRLMPWFDDVLVDPRPRFTDLPGWFRLVRSVLRESPSRVYDFQGKARQSVLFHLLGGSLFGPLWSGAARFCSHPRPWPPKPGAHVSESMAAQLAHAGVIVPEAPPDMTWLTGDIAALNLPERFAVLIPGCAPQHGHKRWPAESYAQLACHLGEKGMACVAVGTKADTDSIAAIRAHAPKVMDLSGQTSLGQLAEVLRRAELVVGNDTGPTHLAAMVGARTLALMSDRVNPLWSSPKGVRSRWLQGKPLATLSLQEVLNGLAADF